MKRLQLFTICLMLSALSFGQDNQSDGLVQQSIFNPIGQQFGGQEIFRFQPGVVTQLNNGNDFGFSNSRWFSLGELNTGSQTVLGLRFQLPRRAAIFGYQNVEEGDPRIQWFDANSTDEPDNFEFRFADDFESTESDLVATFTAAQDVVISPNPVTNPFSSINRLSVNGSNREFGTFSTSKLNDGVGYAIVGYASSNGANVGVFGRNQNNSSSQFEYAIYGVSGNLGSNNYYAGFFEGDVNVLGTLSANQLNVGSDKKLKEDLKESDNALNRLSQLKSYTFNFKDHDHLNLPSNLQHGFIAQEIEKVYPEFVQKATYSKLDENNELIGTGSYKTVNYIGLISELTAAVNELNEKVEDLKASKTTLVYSSQFTEEELVKIKANGYQLDQNIPNPFSGATSIQYSLPENGPQASIMIFDLSGKLIQSYKLKERNGQLRVNQSELGESGMYLYSLFAGGKEIMTKRMLVK
jgi:hypothetical protein